jgi:hypothetical protein
MKIEFVKETKLNGEILYSTELDGQYVSDSANQDYDKAHKFYQMLVENNGEKVHKEIMESTEINK